MHDMFPPIGPGKCFKYFIPHDKKVIFVFPFAKVAEHHNSCQEGERKKSLMRKGKSSNEVIIAPITTRSRSVIKALVVYLSASRGPDERA